ncbi:MAG: hypothetical protein ACO25B_10915 [Chitinophagaceae bacterium]
MKSVKFHIEPYSDKYLSGVTALEAGIIQGSNIKLELVKEHFLDRAKVFENIYPCIALSEENDVIGMAVGAQTKLIINDVPINAGIGFDTKINPLWRNKGVGRMLAKYIYKEFFMPQKLENNFMTAKKSNVPVLKLISRALPDVWIYDFVYLTIPTSSRTKAPAYSSVQLQQFSVQLFDKEEIPADYYLQEGEKPGCFHTYKLYRLRIKRISRLYKFCMALLKNMNPVKYGALPEESDVLSFATLYNHHAGNIHGIDEVLDRLEKKGIRYLLVCCRKNDMIYKLFKNISINEYGYYMISDFRLGKNDRVAIDVRCL